jgi:hypothetical protein
MKETFFTCKDKKGPNFTQHAEKAQGPPKGNCLISQVEFNLWLWQTGFITIYTRFVAKKCVTVGYLMEFFVALVICNL